VSSRGSFHHRHALERMQPEPDCTLTFLGQKHSEATVRDALRTLEPLRASARETLSSQIHPADSRWWPEQLLHFFNSQVGFLLGDDANLVSLV